MQAIYTPKGKAGEYAPLATNPYSGCGHACAYCYVPRIPGLITREVFNAGAVVRPGYLDALRKDAQRLQKRGVADQVLLSFSTDPYHLGDTSVTREALIILRDHGFGFCTLTKGGTRALRDLDLFRPERDAFASSLTCLDDTISRKWERNAALPEDRLDALRTFHRSGIFTWVSLEPTLDEATSIAIIERTHSYVDLFKIGKANYIGIDIDWERYTLQVIETCTRLGVRHYIKQDLQRYLPAGYHNPQAIDQFHTQGKAA
ncbi:radical SAM protein [Candidatus Chloroploca sp. M-50]|uniref:Radical SAM protein n=1 Tax=Candidatus Chloroploca mongolica TaxID=2528176 RepID=A0ABS4DDX2_9CHLR|nr:radical SAM protein [Candidatus Chloroploca mongolica]MBP1467636.1 radical SAM protein [Candidatus Chloroploca mongolica]